MRRIGNSRRWFLAAVLFFPVALQAATLKVTKTADTADGVCDADCSLREAVIQANQIPGTDTIEIPEGKYTITILGQDDTAQAGDLDITDTLVILGKGTSPGKVILDGNGQSRVLDIFSNASLEMRHVMVRGGADGKGAGAYVSDGGSVVFDDVLFRANVASETGGGIYFEGVTGSVIQNSSFLSNTALKGGAIAIVDSGVKISKSILSLNEAGSRGGALFVTGPTSKPTLISDTIKYNKAVFGGGIEVEDGTTTIQSSAIYYNQASGSGGGIDMERNVVISSSTIAGNEALDGVGGGIYSTAGGDLSLNSVTLKQNLAGAGAGIYNSGLELNLQNTLLIYNVNMGGKPNPNLDGKAVSKGHNLLGAVDTNNVQTQASDQVGVPFALEVESLIESDVAGGTYIPLSGVSPAINKGDCTGSSKDQLGRAFVGACDVGAIESICGDGIVLTQNGEECDDGNGIVGDGCSDMCKKEVAAPPPEDKKPPEADKKPPEVDQAIKEPVVEEKKKDEIKQDSDTSTNQSNNDALTTSSGCSLIR